MELIYKINKPQAITDFLHDHQIPLKLIVIEDNKQKIVVNNDLKTRKDTIRKGDTLRITIPDEEADEGIVPEAIPLSILYEDDYLLIVDKPYEMPLMVTKNHPNHTLANALAFYYQTHQILSKIHIVNRMDIDAGGLILVVKNRFIKFLISQSEIQKEYYAIIDGIVPNKTLRIDLPIGKVDETSPKRRVSETGEDAVTDFTVIKEFKTQSLVKITNETGKTHQIRVHFAHFGFPLVGDLLYNPKATTPSTLLLYLNHLIVKHPLTGQPINIDAPMPQSFKTYLSEKGVVI